MAVTEFEALDRSVAAFRCMRDAVAAPGVSWAAEAHQLETLVRRHPERTRQILHDITRESPDQESQP